MKLLANPEFMRIAIPVAISAIVFLAAVVLAAVWIRGLRKRLLEERELGTPRPAAGEDALGFSLAAYNGVIQRLKEQELELQGLRQAERGRAATSESISEAVLSNLTSGVLLFGNTGMVRQANAAAKSILGYASPYGLHARDIFRGVTSVRHDGLGDANADSLLEALDQCLRHGLPFRRIEAAYVTPAGERRVLGITISPVRGAVGEAMGVACLVSDLTEITDLARDMRTREKLSALGEMSAGIAHEFKNSLATISGYAQMLTGENDSSTVRQFAAKIVAETSNLTRVVTDFLSFARPEGGSELHSEEVAVHPLIEECARECGVAVSLAGLPPDLTIAGDRTALRQAFSNLLRNSAEAAAATAVPLRVEISAQTGPGMARLTFRDNGPGIPREHLARIFIPFFTTKAQGTGLGLALVHRIVSEHGGAIAVDSGPSGTVFTLSFPVKTGVRSTVGPQ